MIESECQSQITERACGKQLNCDIPWGISAFKNSAAPRLGVEIYIMLETWVESDIWLTDSWAIDRILCENQVKKELVSFYFARYVVEEAILTLFIGTRHTLVQGIGDIFVRALTITKHVCSLVFIFLAAI